MVTSFEAFWPLSSPSFSRLAFLRRRTLLRLCVNHERARCAPIRIGHIRAEVRVRERSVFWHCRAAPLFEPRVSLEFRCERSSTVRRSGFHARVATRALPLQAADMSELSLLPGDQSRAVADTSSLHARRPARRRCYPGALRRCGRSAVGFLVWTVATTARLPVNRWPLISYPGRAVSTPYLLNRSRLLVIVRSISRSLTMSSSLHVTALRDAYQKKLV